MTPLHDLLRRVLQEPREFRAVRSARGEAERRASITANAAHKLAVEMSSRLDELTASVLILAEQSPRQDVVRNDRRD